MPAFTLPKSLTAVADWVNRDTSVFDSSPERIARAIARVLGVGDPASEVTNALNPLSLPGAVGIGITKTVTPKGSRAMLDVPSLITQTGRWLGNGVANEAVDWFARRWPRAAQQVEWGMNPKLLDSTLARFRADDALDNWAEAIYAGGPRYGVKIGRLDLNPMYYGKRGSSHPAIRTQQVADAVASIAHEAQHVGDNLRMPKKFKEVYDTFNVTPWSYDINPIENLANITGSLTRAKYLRDVGVFDDAIRERLLTDATGLRGAFRPNDLNVIDELIPAPTLGTAEDVLRQLRAPNRAVAKHVGHPIRTNPRYEFGLSDYKRKALVRQLPDVLRRAILEGK